MNDIDLSTITVTMSMDQYTTYSEAKKSLNQYIEMLERANQNGKAVMTDELRTVIEEIYC